MDWQDFGTAFALMLIFEGISPFIMPDRFRRLAVHILNADDQTIRMIAMLSMVSGLGLLFWFRS